MKKTAVAALVMLACLVLAPEGHAQMRARTWEVSPYAGLLNGSAAVADGVEPTAGVRLGYSLNRWWQIELAYGLVQETPVEQDVGQFLTTQQGMGVVRSVLSDVEGMADSDVDMLDFNIILNAHARNKRWYPYASSGIGLADFSGRLTQQQIDRFFPQGPHPIIDAFDFDNDGNRVELIDEFYCSSCNQVILDPNNPVTSRRFVPGGSLKGFDSTQWNFGGGVRIQLTDAMALRLDLRNITGLTRTYNNQVLSAGLSFRFGGEAPIDDDEDGVPSYRDKCPDTPLGATVDAPGCPSDSDTDEILDGLDECPGTPEGWPVDGKGCPLDTDGDGVPDGQEQCPDTPKGAVVDFEGCPVDSDGDTVPDGIDQCQRTPQGAKVDEQGCPIDSDGDSVADGLDQCEETPTGLPVDAQGCPIDSDGDGLKDDVDRCPAFNGAAGVDDEGCPRLRLDKQNRMPLPGVTFASGSSTLTDAAQTDLDALIEALRFYGKTKIEVEGHTDNVGSEQDNFVVSVDRAKSVRRYLTDAGIDPARIETRGFGEIRPVGDNETSAGRATNRRIEVLVTGTMEDVAPPE